MAERETKSSILDSWVHSIHLKIDFVQTGPGLDVGMKCKSSREMAMVGGCISSHK